MEQHRKKWVWPKFFDKFQNSIAAARTKFKRSVRQVIPVASAAQVHYSLQLDSLDEQLRCWRKNPQWIDEPPSTQVTVPKGSLCQLDCTFKVGLPPDAVFNIITDPNNKRVFKNIQKVKYRKVIKDEGHRQLVEVEESAIWKFLWLSGTLVLRVYVDQNRLSHTVSYKLAKTGFMKKFEGSWVITPLLVDTELNSKSQGRIASIVELKQQVQLSIMPPPPISWYVRGITAKTTETMIRDLQAEGKRIREGPLMLPDIYEQVESDQMQEENIQTNWKDWKPRKKSKWMMQQESEGSRWHITNKGK